MLPHSHGRNDDLQTFEDVKRGQVQQQRADGSQRSPPSLGAKGHSPGAKSPSPVSKLDWGELPDASVPARQQAGKVVALSQSELARLRSSLPSPNKLHGQKLAEKLSIKTSELLYDMAGEQFEHSEFDLCACMTHTPVRQVRIK